MDTASLIRTAKLIAVPLPWALAGYGVAFSQNAVPTLYDTSASVATPVFKKIFNSGAAIIVPGAILSAAASGYLAYTLPEQRTVWAAAAVLSVLPMAFTAVVMMSGIQRLIAISEDKTKQEKATANLEHRQLLIKWVNHNYMRQVMYAAAGVVALRATIGV